MKSLIPLWNNCRAILIGWQLRHLNPMAPQLPALVLKKNEYERRI